MTELNKKIELETSTDTAIDYSTCDAQPFDSVIHSDFLNNKYQPLK
jgi:hypothetical protein